MDEKKATTDERLILDDGAESVQVPPTAFAEFEAAIAASLEQLVERWAALASPRARREAAGWRR